MGIITTYTNLGLVQQPDGGNNNTWGDVLDSVIASIDQAIAGVTTINVAGAANVTLSFANGDLPAADQARNALIIFTGVLTGNINITVPQITKTWVMVNQTTGSFSITITTGVQNGTSVVMPNTTVLPALTANGVTAATGWGMLLFCDGTNVSDQTVNFKSTLRVQNLIASGGQLDGFVLDGGQF